LAQWDDSSPRNRGAEGQLSLDRSYELFNDAVAMLYLNAGADDCPESLDRHPDDARAIHDLVENAKKVVATFPEDIRANAWKAGWNAAWSMIKSAARKASDANYALVAQFDRNPATEIRWLEHDISEMNENEKARWKLVVDDANRRTAELEGARDDALRGLRALGNDDRFSIVIEEAIHPIFPPQAESRIGVSR
jgi:hypothetical protein